MCWILESGKKVKIKNETASILFTHTYTLIYIYIYIYIYIWIKVNECGHIPQVNHKDLLSLKKTVTEKWTLKEGRQEGRWGINILLLINQLFSSERKGGKKSKRNIIDGTMISEGYGEEIEKEVKKTQEAKKILHI